MRVLLLAACIASILAVSFISTTVKYVQLAELANYGGRTVVTSGLAIGKKLCNNGKCISLAGKVKPGFRTIRGSIAVKNGEATIFVQRVE